MSDPVSGRVFISYRRQETSGLAGRLYERLAARLSDDQVFMDVDTIAPGLDFAEVITEAVSTCEVLLAVIGPRWLDAKDEDGQRRLEDPDDIVRLEIAAALERNIRVIPILVEGAQMPRLQQLPDGSFTAMPARPPIESSQFTATALSLRALQVYGKDPQTIFATIMEGRPNGMPSFRGRIPEEQAWQIVAYVRSMSGLVSSQAAPNRGDTLLGAPPENLREPAREEGKR